MVEVSDKLECDPKKVAYECETNQGTVTLVFVERLPDPPHIALYAGHSAQGVLALFGHPVDHISKLMVLP
jgi:hypothetical protein